MFKKGSGKFMGNRSLNAQQKSTGVYTPCVLVSAGIALIFLSVAAVFWTRRIWITLVFSVVAVKSRTFFPVSRIQLMSKCAEAGRKQSQTSSQAGRCKYSIP